MIIILPLPGVFMVRLSGKIHIALSPFFACGYAGQALFVLWFIGR
jgi:hypothetical protein